jgi:hypothetical protein
MGKRAWILTHGGNEYVPPSLAAESLTEIEKNLSVQFSEACRASILGACHRYCKNEIAFRSRVRRAEIEPELKWLNQRLAEILEWRADSASNSEVDQAILRVMRRAFPNPMGSGDPQRLQQFFNDLLAVYNEISSEIASLRKGASSGLELEPSAWDLWVQSLRDALEPEGLWKMPRHDDDAAERPSFVVLLINELHKYVPPQHSHSNRAVAQAVQRAIGNVAP